MTIHLTARQINLLINETRKRYPIEACGILFGDISSEGAVIRRIVMARNMLASSTNFQIEPEEFLRALRESEKDDMQLVGFFHSHPAAPYPSVTDAEYMKLWPESIWLIVSSLSYHVGAFQSVDDKLQRINIELGQLT